MSRENVELTYRAYDAHLYALNRGVLMTPFHNMALMCPATTTADVNLHTEVFEAALGELVA